MLVSVRKGSNILYLFSQIRMVCAFIPVRFSRSLILKVFFTLLMANFLFNKSNKKSEQNEN